MDTWITALLLFKDVQVSSKDTLALSGQALAQEPKDRKTHQRFMAVGQSPQVPYWTAQKTFEKSYVPSTNGRITINQKLPETGLTCSQVMIFVFQRQVELNSLKKLYAARE